MYNGFALYDEASKVSKFNIRLHLVRLRLRIKNGNKQRTKYEISHCRHPQPGC